MPVPPHCAGDDAEWGAGAESALASLERPPAWDRAQNPAEHAKGRAGPSGGKRGQGLPHQAPAPGLLIKPAIKQERRFAQSLSKGVAGSGPRQAQPERLLGMQLPG